MLKLLFFALPIAVLVGLLMLGGFYISPQQELAKSDAIIVVSGGDTRSRTLEGVKLYRQGWAPILIFSGAAQDPKSPSNAQQMREIAVDEGIPLDAIALEERAQNTRQNADQVSGILKTLKAERVILVTSPYHQRRAGIEFSRRLGSGIEIINHPAPDKSWSRRWWWTNPVGWYYMLTELPKTLFTMLNHQFAP